MAVAAKAQRSGMPPWSQSDMKLLVNSAGVMRA